MTKNDSPRAVSREVDNILALNADVVLRFKDSLAETSIAAYDAVIVLANVVDDHGSAIADALMPGNNWREFCELEDVFIVRGLANRRMIQGVLGTFDLAAATKLLAMRQLAVVVVDQGGVAEVFFA